MHYAILEAVKKIKAIADVGLLYASIEYDKQRYAELQSISYSMLEELSGQPIETIKHCFPATKDYPTAKVDVRGIVINEDHKILLAKEMEDGKWSLPGGWADIGYSPKETVIKEFKEETGLDIRVERLLAIFDKKMHLHPPQLSYVYKLVFHCTAISQLMEKGFDVLDLAYFDINNLPALSEDRILESQIQILYNKIQHNDLHVYCD